MSFKRAAFEDRTSTNSTADCIQNTLPHPSRCSLGKRLSLTLTSCLPSLGIWGAPISVLSALIRIIHKKRHTSRLSPVQACSGSHLPEVWASLFIPLLFVFYVTDWTSGHSRNPYIPFSPLPVLPSLGLPDKIGVNFWA
ncbi:mCG66633 [Mus musculus]|nr:mCG66633 [Mus musculus]